jgi:hypothetical protein
MQEAAAWEEERAVLEARLSEVRDNTIYERDSLRVTKCANNKP